MRKVFILLLGILFFSLDSFGQDERTVVTIDGQKYSVSQFYDFCSERHLPQNDGRISSSALQQFVDYELEKRAALSMMKDSLPKFNRVWEHYKADCLKCYLADSLRNGGDSAVSKSIRYRVRLLIKQLPQLMPLKEQNRWMARWDSLYRKVRETPAEFVGLADSCSDEKGILRLREVELPSELAGILSGMKPDEISKPLFVPQGVAMVQLLGVEMDAPESPMVPRNGALSEKKALMQHLANLCGATLYADNLQAVAAGNHAPGPLLAVGKKEFTEQDFHFYSDCRGSAGSSSLQDFIIKSLLDCLYSSPSDYSLPLQSRESFVDSLCKVRFEKELMRKWAAPSSEELSKFISKNLPKADRYIYRFEGILFRCRSHKEMKSVRRFLKRIPASERMTAVRLTFQQKQPYEVLAAEGVFENGSNCYVDKAVFGLPAELPSDGYPFVGYIGRKSRRKCTADELRQRGIGRYQSHCLQEWHNSLKRNSMIEFNEEVIKSVNNGR